MRFFRCVRTVLNPDAAVGDRPIDFWSVPELQFFLLIVVSMQRCLCSEALCFGQQFELVLFEIDDPIQTQSFDLSNKWRLRIERNPLPINRGTDDPRGRANPVIRTANS